jgi:hypothetical protein
VCSWPHTVRMQVYEDDAEFIVEVKDGRAAADMEPEFELKNLKIRFDSWKKDFKNRMRCASVPFSLLCVLSTSPLYSPCAGALDRTPCPPHSDTKVLLKQLDKLPLAQRRAHIQSFVAQVAAHPHNPFLRRGSRPVLVRLLTETGGWGPTGCPCNSGIGEVAMCRREEPGAATQRGTGSTVCWQPPAPHHTNNNDHSDDSDDDETSPHAAGVSPATYASSPASHAASTPASAPPKKKKTALFGGLFKSKPKK